MARASSLSGDGGLGGFGGVVLGSVDARLSGFGAAGLFVLRRKVAGARVADGLRTLGWDFRAGLYGDPGDRRGGVFALRRVSRGGGGAHSGNDDDSGLAGFGAAGGGLAAAVFAGGGDDFSAAGDAGRNSNGAGGGGGVGEVAGADGGDAGGAARLPRRFGGVEKHGAGALLASANDVARSGGNRDDAGLARV